MKNTIRTLILLICLTGCETMDFDDPRSFTLEEALAITPDYYFKLAAGSFSDAVYRSTEGNLNGMYMLADQSGTTNRVNEWWDFTIEPRKRLNNSQSYGGYSHFNTHYNRFYQINLDATKVIEGLNEGNPGIDEAGNDRTHEVYAIAYFAKGVAQGYLGAIFDRGIIVEEDLGVDGEIAFPNSYRELIESAVDHIDRAIAAANAAPSITLGDFYVNLVLDKPGFIKLANSYAARILAAIPRDRSEAEALGASHWNRVLAYANAGFTEDYIVEWVSGGFRNDNVYRHVNVLGSGGGYLPADLKVAYLADKTGTHPYEYPMDESVILGPVETDDARFYEYFTYTEDFGYFRVDRGRNLFSNYYHNRWRGGRNDYLVRPGGLNPVFLAEEVRLLRSEAKFWLGDLAGAAAELNAPDAERITLGNLPAIAATADEIRHTLHYEYSISIAAAGSMINPFTFMRRNNLLQVGTPTQFPIPEAQILLTDDPIPYTFGGIDYVGERGIWGEVATASEGGWKPSR